MNANHLFCSLLAAALLFFQSCATHGPAYLGNAGTYLAKPVYHDKPAGALYFSGSVNKGHVYYKNECNRSFELSSHVMQMWKHFYLGGGLFGYGGKYEVKNGSTAHGMYGFNGFGMRLELGGRIPLDERSELLLGFSEGFFGQGGDLETATNQDFEDIFSETFSLGIDGYHAGLHAEFRYVPSAKTCFGLRYAYEGAAGGEISSPPAGFQHLESIHRLSLSATFDRVTAFGQLGFTNNSQQMINVGLSYGIPFRKNRT